MAIREVGWVKYVQSFGGGSAGQHAGHRVAALLRSRRDGLQLEIIRGADRLRAKREKPRRSLSDVRPVRLGGKQLFQRSGVRYFKLDHPAGAIGVAIDDARVLVQLGVHLNDLTSDRAVELGDRLHRLDFPEGLMRIQALT